MDTSTLILGILGSAVFTTIVNQVINRRANARVERQSRRGEIMSENESVETLGRKQNLLIQQKLESDLRAEQAETIQAYLETQNEKKDKRIEQMIADNALAGAWEEVRNEVFKILKKTP